MPSLLDLQNNLSHPPLRFDFETYLEQEMNIYVDLEAALQAHPELALDSNGICRFFAKGFCPKGNSCPHRHTKPDPNRRHDSRQVVCKHWLRGLCKKGDQCEFLHEYNLKKMPECWFFTKYGQCSNPECQYLHIDPASKVIECPWYARGFCKHGPNCKNKHVRKVPCKHYLAGFCPKGPDCAHGHPKYELPVMPNNNMNRDQPQRPFQPQPQQQQYHQQPPMPRPPTDFNQQRPQRNLDEVTCFKCGAKGHYANHCPQRRQYAQLP